ncbi:MAG TPA: Ig-like domain-containing protein [Thermoanaerobaculia bacterium]|nr:Ig-like domain-containing protein [Thermoanaerobaculia bacterium]
MRRAVSFAATLLLWTASAFAQAPPEVSYSDGFQSYGTPSNPPGWVDTSVGSPHPTANGLYKTWPDPLTSGNVVYGTKQSSGKPEGNNPRIGTFSTLTTKFFAGEGRFEYRGRLLRTNADTRIGLTFFSSYPEVDRYYLIGLWSQPSSANLTMQLFGFGGGTPAGTVDSNVPLTPNQWYRFVIQVDDAGNATRIRARFWLDGQTEPATFAIDAVDASVSRLTSGRIGIWSAVKGDAYVDDLYAKSPVDHGGPIIRIFESGNAIADGAKFNRDAVPDIRVTDELSTVTYTATLDGAAYTTLTPVASEGWHTLFVRAVDAPGNISTAQLRFLIDKTPPQISVLESGAPFVAGTLFRRDVIATASATDLGAVVTTATLDGNEYILGTPIVVEGEHLLVVNAIDEVGWTATSGPLPFTIDKTAPVISFTSHQNGALLTTARASIAGGSDDAIAVTVNGIAAAVDPVSRIFTIDAALLEGENTLVAIGVDRAGNSGSATIRLEVDTRAPELTINTPAEDACVDTSMLMVSGTVSDPRLDVIKVTLGTQSMNAAVTGNAWTASIPAEEGKALLTVEARDASAHATSLSRRVIIDRTAPVIEVTSGGEAFTATLLNHAVSLLARATDADANVSVTAALDGTPYISSTQITAEGAHALVVNATDCAGHAAEKTIRFTIDTTPPGVRELVPAHGATLGSLPTAISGRTDADTASIRIEGTTLAATLSGEAFSIAGVPFVEGTNRFTLVVSDHAGNSATTEYSVIVRTAAPPVEILESGSPIPANALFNRAVTPVIRTAGGAQATIVATLNGAPFTTGTTITGDGAYTLSATATDDLGHSGSAQATFTIDRTAPVVTITAPLDGASVQSDRVEVRGSVGDAIAALANGVPVTIGNGGAYAIELPLEYGPSPIVVTARDAAGNGGRASIIVTRDDAGSGIILTYPPDHSLTNRPSTDVLGRLLTVGRGTTVKVGTRNVDVDPTGAFRVAGYALTEGENSITATATATNGLITAATTHVTADFTPPSLVLFESNAPLADGARFATQAIIDASASDGGGSVTTEVTIDGTLQTALPSTVTAVGGHSIVAVAHDRAGNQARSERMLFIGTATASADCRLEGFDPADNSVVLANRTTLAGRSGGAIGVKVNGVAALVADGGFSANVELPNEGANVVTVQCTDANGAATGTPATLTLQRVTGQPSIAITSPSEDFITAQETIAVSGTIGAGVVSADVNGTPATINGSTFTANGVHLSDGLNIVVAHGRDAAGRTATASRRGTYEKDLPSLSISSPGANTTTGVNRITVGGTYSNLDPGTITVTNLSGGQTVGATTERFSDTTGSFSAVDVPLAGGEQTLRVTGRDRLNRQATAAIVVKLVSGSPSIAITSPANQSYFPGGSSTFEVSGTFGGAAGSTVDVNGSAAAINGNTFSATANFSTLITPVVARVTEPGGASAASTIFVTQLVDAPVVRETFPANDAVEVDGGALLLVLFSQPMDAATLHGGAFRLEDANGAPLSGTLFVDREVATFAPATLLTGGMRYTMRVSTAAKNLAGTPLANAFASSFTVASSAAASAPVVEAIGDAVCGQSLTVRGTASPAARVRLESGALVLTTAADTTGKFAFTYPLSGQSGFTLIRVRTVGSDGSLSPAAELTVRVDCSGPQVLNATFDRNANALSISFSEAIEASTVGVGSSIVLSLTDGSTVGGTASVSNNAVVVTPASDLRAKTFTLTVGTSIEDVTGNKLLTPYAQEFATGGDSSESTNGAGFLSGEVYDATTGRPLANATIAVDVASPAPITTTTDARGRYLARVPEGAHTIRASHAGHTTVWREIIVPAGAGVIPIDIRLTLRGDAKPASGAPLTLTHGGDTAVTKPVELTIPSLAPGANISLTAVGAQALTGLLPLGWSSYASAEIDAQNATTLGAATLTFHTVAGEVATAAQNLSAVRYDSARDEWRVLQAVVNIASDGRASIAIDAPGSYALVYPDKAPGLTAPPLPVAGDVLQGVPAAGADAPELVDRDFKLDPPVVLPTGRAVATLRIEGAGGATFPSGTAVQAYIDEDLRLADGSRLLDPPFATDLLLYRNLSGDLGIADFHLAPSAKAAQVVLEVGFEHIRVLPYPGRLDRGTLIGSEGGRVPADDKVSVEIPTGSVPEPLRATATSLSATDLDAIGTVAGFRVVGGFQLALQRATQPAPQDLDGDGSADAVPAVELFVPARATFRVDAAKMPGANAQVILAELLDATPHGRLLRLAVPMMAVDGTSTPVIRFTTKSIDRSVLPVDGVIREGRYVVLAAEGPIAYATGTLHMRELTGRLLEDARITAPPLGVQELTRIDGIFNSVVPAKPAAAFTLVPRHLTTGDGAAYTHTAQVEPDSVTRIDLTLVPQPPLLGSVVVLRGDPPSQATLTPNSTTTNVALTTNIRASFTPSIDPSSITNDSIRVLNAVTGAPVSGRATADGTTGVFWTLTAGERLEPGTPYLVVIANSIRGTNGAALTGGASYSFTTVAVVLNTEIHRERIRITIPDANGLSRISGLPGAIPANWQAVAVRRTRDFHVRYQATAASDGSFSFVIGDDDPRDRVTMADLIDLRIINSNGILAAIFPLTPFVTEDGRGFVANPTLETKFTTPEGITVVVPEGTFDEPTIVTVNTAQKADFLDIPEVEAENEYVASVDIQFDGVAKKRLDIEVPVPPGFDTNGKDFLLAWKGESVRGPRLAVMDLLRIEGGRFTTTEEEEQSARNVGTNLKTAANATLTGRKLKAYLLGLIMAGRYMVLDIRVPVGGAVGWAAIDGQQQNYDIMWDTFWSYYDPYIHIFERPVRVIPVITGKPFTVYGIDRATGLQAYKRAYDPIPAGEPGTIVSIPSPQQNDGGPYPVFGSPFRVEVLDINVENVDVRTIRNFNVRAANESITVTPSDDPLDSKIRVQMLNVKRGTQTSGTATSSLMLGGKLGDRIVLLIEQTDSDPGLPVSVVFNEPLHLGTNLEDADAIDTYLHDHLKLEQAPEPPFPGDPVFTDITAQARFVTDSGDRRLNVQLPGALQREAVYRLTLKSTLTDTTTSGAGLKLGQGTEEQNGSLVPVGGGADLPLVFHVRKPQGKVGSFSAADSGALRGMDASGNVLFVAALDGGLRAYDVSNPAALNGSAPQLSQTIGPPNTAYKTQAITIDRHDRIYTTADLNIVGVLRSYRVEDFVNGTATASSARGTSIINWKLGYSSMIGLPSNTILSDRPESIPFRLKVVTQDDVEDYVDREAFEAAPGVSPTGDFPLDDLRTYTVSAQYQNSDYAMQRITLENLTLDMRWSGDAPRGGSTTFANVVARSTDKLRLTRNEHTYAVVAHLGYGVGVYDANAIEENDLPGAAGSGAIREQLFLNNGTLPKWCNVDPPLWAIGENYINTDVEVRGDPAGDLYVYANHPTKGVLDYMIHLPRENGDPGSNDSTCDQRGQTGLVFQSYPQGNEPARIQALRGAILSAGGSGYMHTMNMAKVGWTVSADQNKKGLRGTIPNTDAYKDYLLVAALDFGVVVVEIDHAPKQRNKFPLANEHIADVLWVPGGAAGVRVMPDSNTAVVTDRNGRVVLIDLSRIDERWDASGQQTSGLFPTAAKAIAGTPSDPNEIGADDPRIIWKSEPGLTSGSLPPLFDASTGMIYGGNMSTREVKVVSAVDPTIRMLANLGGLKDIGGVVPLGIAPTKKVQDEIGALPPCGEGQTACRENASIAAFRLEVGLPGDMLRSMTRSQNELWMAVESERVPGSVTEQTPAGVARAHLRRKRRDGSSETGDRAASNFRFKRVLPESIAASQKHQRGYNRFISPWIIAIADPRASEQYNWNGLNAAQKEEAGCFSCERPQFLKNKTEADDVYELWTNGRFISVRPEGSGFTNDTVFEGTPYEYLGEHNRMTSRFTTIMADTVRSPEVLVAAQNAPVAAGMIQETLFLHSGEMQTSTVDLNTGGRAGFDVAFGRTYRSRTIGGTVFGQGWDSMLLRRLRALPNGDIEYRDGADVWRFKTNANGSYEAPKGLYLRLARTQRGWKLIDQKVRITEFDDYGRILIEFDEYYSPDVPGSGNIVQYIYDENGRLAAIVDPVNRTSRLTYWTEAQAGTQGAFPGLLRQVTDWRDRRIDYQYDSSTGTLLKVDLPEVENTDGGRPAVKYTYLAASGYSDSVELRNLHTITEPHEVASGGGARVTFDYFLSGGLLRDRASRQTWATGETATFTYSSATQATTTDAYQQVRNYTLTQQPKDYMSDRAHLLTIAENDVTTASGALGSLPQTLTAGVPQTSSRTRQFSFSYNAQGDLETASTDGVRSSTFTYKDVQPQVPGYVVGERTESGAGGAITEKYEYQSGDNSGTYIQSIKRDEKTIMVGDGNRNNRNPRAIANAIEAIKDCDFDGLIKSITSSGGGGQNARRVAVNSAQSVSTTFAHVPATGALHARGLLTRVDRGGGISTSIQHPSANQRVVTNERGVTTTLSLDAWGRAISTDVAGPGETLHEEVKYDATGNVAETRRKQGGATITTKYKYDPLGRILEKSVDNVAGIGVATTTFTYDMAGRTTTVAYPGGATTVSKVDGLGRVQHVHTETGSSPLDLYTAYDLDDNIVYRSDLFTASAMAFDAHGRLVGRIYPDGTRATVESDAWGNPERMIVTDRGGAKIGETTFGFTAAGELESAMSAVDSSQVRQVAYAWDAAQRPTGMSVGDRAASSEYDAGGRLLSTSYGEGSAATVTSEYGGTEVTGHDGKLPQQSKRKERGAGYDTALQFNTSAKVVAESIGSLSWSQRVDEAGNVTSLTQPNRGTHTYNYDSRGAVTDESLPGGDAVQYGYAASGALNNYVDPSSEATQVTSDNVGRPLVIRYKDGTSETITWEGPRVKSITSREGRTQTFTYNNFNEVIQITGDGGAVLDDIAYDDAGRVRSWKNADALLEYSDFNYDGKPGRTALTRYRGGVALDRYEQTHTWNEHGERASFTMPTYSGFLSSRPWTAAITMTHDALGNVTGMQRTMFGGSAASLLLQATYRNAMRPDRRTVTTTGGQSVVRDYSYDAANGLLKQLAVSVGGRIVAGSVVEYDGTQKARARLLAVSGGERASEWSYDARSRLRSSSLGVDESSTPHTDDLSSADFRNALVRTAPTPADPPSMLFIEDASGGHKIDRVQRGDVVEDFTYAGGERRADGRYTYQYDGKGRLSLVTEKPLDGKLSVRRVHFAYDGNDRIVGRTAEYAELRGNGLAPLESDWKLEDRLSVLAADALPAETTFVWDPVSDQLVSIFRAGASNASSSDLNGGLVRQIVHGGIGYDDPIEVTTVDGNSVAHLYPVFDEAGAGSLQTVLNAGGEIVSRSIQAGAYGEDEAVLVGAAVDRVSINTVKDSQGNVTGVTVKLRATEDIDAGTLQNGVRLAAVSASGVPLRVSSSVATLGNSATAQWSLTKAEWDALVDASPVTVGGNAIAPVALSVGVTSSLRADAWSAAAPVLAAPSWAVQSMPVHSTAAMPVEVRESLSGVTSLVQVGGSRDLYRIPTLYALGSARADAWIGDPQRLIVAGAFHAHPFQEPLTQQNFVRARWYDVQHGVWLTPDPMGYVDSPNLYAYAGGDPVNGRDPSGQYEADFHFGLTMYLAMKAGFNSEQAHSMANYTVQPDREDDERTPIKSGAWGALGNEDARERLRDWHFPKAQVESGEVVPCSTWAREKIDRALRTGNFKDFGEGLHPFQDSWSHRGDPSLGGYAGHPDERGGGAAHDTDWSYRYPDVAMTAAHATYVYLQAYALKHPEQATGSSQPWSSIESDVRLFVNLRTKIDKRAWLEARGVHLDELWKDVSLREGDETIDEMRERFKEHHFNEGMVEKGKWVNDRAPRW